MNYNLYAMRDNLVGFLSPMVDDNDESAKRNFALMIQNSNGVLGFRPKDFDLFKIGSFDTKTGIVMPLSPIEYIVSGNAMIGVKENE